MLPDVDRPQVVLDDAWTYFLSQQRVPTSVLYHYTSKSALLNILKTKRMWATDLRFMNDPEELEYSLKVIESVIDSTALRQRDSELALWLMFFKRQLRDVIAKSTFYSISLCENADDREQWREYGINGDGFALGWSVDSPHPEIPLRIGVVYDPEAQEQLVRRLIEIHLASIRKEGDLREGVGLASASFAAGSLGFFVNVWRA